MRLTCTLPMRWFRVLALLISAPLLVAAQNPTPFLSQPLVPDSIAPGVQAFTPILAVNGTGFVPASTVNWNGNPRITKFVTNSRLMVQLLLSDLAVPGSAWITVTNPSPGGGTSNTLYLPIHSPIHALSFRRTDYSVGGNPQYAEAADFRGNGKLDLAVANNGTGMVSILLGNGDGTFQNAHNYSAGSCAQMPIIGDFNRDGKLDIAVPYCGGVAILLGNGDGTFQTPVSYPIGGGPIQGITADFNGDGNLDLAIGGFSSGISVLLGNGDGTFRPYVLYPVNGSVQTGVQTGDFNRDGRLDLAVADWDTNMVSILLGNGDGTFRSHVDYGTGSNPGVLAIADLNGDSKLDLAIPNQSSGTVSILLGNGDGTFRSHVDYAAPASGGLDIADFNADGKLDLVVSSGSNFDILLGNGNGTFQRYQSFNTGPEAWNPLPGDLNRDGRTDFANSDFASGTVSVFLAQPTP